MRLGRARVFTGGGLSPDATTLFFGIPEAALSGLRAVKRVELAVEQKKKILIKEKGALSMRGKNNGSSRPRGPSIGGESMTTLFNDDPLMHGLALFGNGGQLGLLSHTPPSFAPGSYEVCVSKGRIDVEGVVSRVHRHRYSAQHTPTGVQSLVDPANSFISVRRGGCLAGAPARVIIV